MVFLPSQVVKSNIAVADGPAVQPPAGRFVERLTLEDQELLHKVLTEPAEYVQHSEFSKRGVMRRLYGGEPEWVDGDAPRFVDPPAFEVGSAGGTRVPTLTHEQEKLLFMRYNFARRAAVQILDDYLGKKLTAAAAKKLLAWSNRALDTRTLIVRLNMPLVLAMGKRTRLTNIDFNELVSEGNMALLRSVEKFDVSRGFKFSTYSCRAILKSFSRVAMRASRYRGRFPTEFDPAMERSDYIDKKRGRVEEDCVDELKRILLGNLAQLSEVERTVISERFALGVPSVDGMPTAKTLEQVGNIIGVTKERVRQIQNKALKKIRGALEEEYLAA